jgi:hypothetical protein
MRRPTRVAPQHKRFLPWRSPSTESDFWFSYSSENASHMKKTQIIEAQRRAEDWVETSTPPNKNLSPKESRKGCCCYQAISPTIPKTTMTKVN